MTGFAAGRKDIPGLGRVTIQLKSTNHKFLEIVFSLPEGFLAWEEKIRKEVEPKFKRGRLLCAVNIVFAKRGRVVLHKEIIRQYIKQISQLRHEFGLQGKADIDTVLKLPGVLSMAETEFEKEKAWEQFKGLLAGVLNDLVISRKKEGRALAGFLRSKAERLKKELRLIGDKFEKMVEERTKRLASAEERSCFLKEADITEELERLSFHVKSFLAKLAKGGCIGKELDFLAQEMQREANTMAAKSCHAGITARVVQVKSQIEKIREQVQNIE